MKVIRKMENKETIIMLILLVLVAVGLGFYFVKGYIDSLNKASDYTLIEGTVYAVNKFEQENEDGGYQTFYATNIRYIVDGCEYTHETTDLFSRKQELGDKHFILYREGDPRDSYVAMYDVLSKKYIAYTEQRGVQVFFVLFLFSFVAIMGGTLLPGKKTQSIIISTSMIVVGASGVAAAMIDKITPMYITAIFGARGLYMLIKEMIKSSHSDHNQGSSGMI